MNKNIYIVGRNFKILVSDIRIIKESTYLSMLYDFNVKSGLYDLYSYIPLDIPAIYDENEVNQYIGYIINGTVEKITTKLLIFVFFIQAKLIIKKLINEISTNKTVYNKFLKQTFIKNLMSQYRY